MKLTRKIEKYSLSTLILFEKPAKILRIYEKFHYARKLIRYNLNRYLRKNRISQFIK